MNAQVEFRFDYFISRCGAVGDIAAEVARVLEDAGYRVKAQDVDFAQGGDFVGDIHDALVEARHLYILHTEAYDRNYWTRKEFTNFLAAAAASGGGRRVCVLRCDAAAPRGILANVVFGDISAETGPEKRRQIILEVAQGETRVKRRDPPFFGGAMPPPILSFVGREATIAAVKDHFEQGRTVAELRAVALVGLGGVGKTATARVIVDRIGSDYVGVWWIAAETRSSLLAGLAALADRLDPGASDADVEKAALRALRRIELSERPYLLVLDNLDDQSLLDLCSPSRGAHLLLTTRRADLFGRAYEIRLDVMDMQDAVAFLQARAGRRDEEGARRLAQAVGCLPLALDHAGAYVKITMMSFEAYAQRADALVSKAPKGAPYPMSLAATFSLAIDNAARDAPEAESCMGIFSLVASERIPLSVGDGLVDEDARFDALAALIGVSLVQPGADGTDEPCVSVHRLVQSVVRARMAANASLGDWTARMLARFRALFPAEPFDKMAEWPRCARWLAHALALCDHAKQEGVRNQDYVRLCGDVAEYLHARASYRSAAALFRDAREAAVTAFGEQHPETALISAKLGNILRGLSQTREAETLLREAFSSSGLRPEDRASIMTSLAELLHGTNRLEEAEALLRESIAMGESQLGRDHPHVAVRLNNLARLRQQRGDAVEAESLFREAIARGEAKLGRSHPQVGERMNNLAKLLQDLARAAEAEALYREAIAIAEAQLDPHSPMLAICRHNLANLLRDSGKCEDAEALYRAAFAALALALPGDHPDLARVKFNLATALARSDKVAEASRLAREAETVHDAALGSDHPWTRQSRELVRELSAGRATNSAGPGPAVIAPDQASH